MKKTRLICLFLILCTLISLSSCNSYNVIYPDSHLVMVPIEYENGNAILTEENELVYFNIDIVDCSADELKSLSNVPEYNKTFGKIDTAKDAYKVAISVLTEIYGEKCEKNEKPFEIFYNSTAQAWIVRGTLPKNYEGGVGCVALDKETGTVLMIRHGR